MRKDILNEINFLRKEGKIVINKSELARRLGCNRKTVAKYLNESCCISDKSNNREYTSKLDNFKPIIIEKVDCYGASAKSVYDFIVKKGFSGKYGIVKKFVKEYKNENRNTATIRFETSPGLQAQVDWKENFKLLNKNNEIFEINIFLIVLGYSRLKYIQLTSNRNQKTLFDCLVNSFKYFKGIPKEILFDNMSTVVDRKVSTFKTITLNDKFKHFSKEIGFTPVLCRPYRPQTKGKVEALAKLMDRLKVYNKEFNTFDDINNIIKAFNEDINNEIISGLFESPNNRYQREKEYLIPLPSDETLAPFIAKYKDYKVSKESLILFNGQKYSVPTLLIGKYVTVKDTDTHIQIYYNSDLITSHQKSEKVFNYKLDHAKEILKSDALKSKSDKEIEAFIEKNLKSLDIFLDQ